MKTTKYFLLTLFFLTTKFGQAQTVLDTMTVFPNPFDSVTTIHFAIMDNDTVSLRVFNITGQTVRTFFSNTALPSGSYSINLYGDTLPYGVYFVRLDYSFDKSIVKKVTRNSSTTAINDVPSDKNKLILYPNPTIDLLTIPIDGQKVILITNLQGQTIKTIQTDTKTISLSDLATGSYIVSIFSADNTLLTTKQIVCVK